MTGKPEVNCRYKALTTQNPCELTVEKLKALLQAKGIMLDMHHLWTAVKTLAAEVFGTPLRGPSHRTDTHA